MRTVILFSSWCIADAINKDWITEDNAKSILALTAVIAIIMDVTEFFIKVFDNKNK